MENSRIEEDLLGDLEGIAAPSNQNNKTYNNSNNKRNYYKNYKNNYNNTNKKKSNVIGKNSINLWNKDTIKPIEIETDKFISDKKYATLVLPNGNFSPSEREIAKFRKIFEALREKNYKVRIVCNHARNIHKLLMDIMGKENIYHITPWKSYCKDEQNLTMYLPTDLNIKASATYFKSFHKLPPSLQYIISSVFTACFGLKNIEPSSFIIIDDPYYKGDKIDFKKSKDTSNYILLARSLGLDLYNINDDDKYVELMKLFK